MARTAARPADERIPYELRFKGKALDWLDKTAARHSLDVEELARELFALGSQHWQREHPEDIDPAATRA